MTASVLLQLLVSGLSVGSIYAIVALALVIPFKASGILNFGQGEIVTVGAYTALVLVGFGMSYWLVLPLTVVIGLLAGIVIERGFIRPIMAAPEFTLVIATFAVGLILKSAIRLYWQDNPFALETPLNADPIHFAGVVLNPLYLWVVLCTLLLVVFLAYFFKYNRLGKSMRAVSQSHDAARLMGIGVERVLMISWGMSAAIGALAGILLAPIVGINPEMGHLVLKALVAAVIGGFTSLPGAFFGGIALGLVETYSGAFFGSTMKNIIPFVLLVVFLLIRPYGLFGKPPVVRI